MTDEQELNEALLRGIAEGGVQIQVVDGVMHIVPEHLSAIRSIPVILDELKERRARRCLCWDESE